MRSLVCAQCHVEYYFRNDESAGLKNYLVFPWNNGTGAEAILSYYNDANFTDFVNPISKTPMIKCSIPITSFILPASTLIATSPPPIAICLIAPRECKFTDHHVQNPLLNISASCAVCHRWSEDEIRSRVEAIQAKTQRYRLSPVEDALVEAHFDIAAASQAGVSDNDLSQSRQLLRDAQFYWDYISSSNGMSFHSPTESMRITGRATDLSQQARIFTARFLAEKGINKQPVYPDISSRQNASQVSQQFIEARLNFA